MGLLNILFGGNRDAEDTTDGRNPFNTVNNKEYTTEDNEDYVSMVLHFTPHMTYVYISGGNEVESNMHQSNIEMTNEQDVFFEVSGTYTLITNVTEKGIDAVLDMYRVRDLGVPHTKIYVE